MHYNYLIIGEGIAGVTAAETIREHDPKGTIAVISQESHLLYSRVLLPNYVKKRVRREQLFLRTIDDFEKKHVTLLLGKEAALLDTERKEVRTQSGETYSFDKLLIASGGTPRALGIPGEAKQGTFRLQTLDDADAILAYLPSATKAAVIGGGFIALEFLEILHVHKVPTTFISRGSRFFDDALDGPGGMLMKENFERHGIQCIFDDEATEFGGKERVEGIRTRREAVIGADFIGIGIGISRNDHFLLGTGISVLPGRGARTNEFLETRTPGIFAAGDIAEYFDLTFGRYHSHGNWTNAFLQGRVAGQNMAGKEMIPFRAISFYSITNLGLHITFLGEVDDSEDSIETVSRVDLPGKKYERFFVREGQLLGAVLINMFHDKTVLTEVIERKISVGGHLGNLQDMAFDVSTLL